MANCVPESSNYVNKAEEKVFNFINKNLNDDYILYHNYEVLGKEFDFLLIDKKSCMYVIEVKGWNAIDVVEILDNKNIKYRDKNNDIKLMTENPLKQVRMYKFNIINLIKERFNLDVRVVHLVCYPNISKKEFEDIRLDLISSEDGTILKDDFEAVDKFEMKLQKANSLSGGRDLILEEHIIEKIRSLFEGESQIKDIKTDKVEIDILNKLDLDTAYSILISINEEESNKNLYRKVIQLWRNGVKIHLVTQNENIIKKVFSNIKESLEYLQRYDEFRIKEETTSIFNFNTYLINRSIGEFIIKDGNYESYSKELEVLDLDTGFNLKQYKLEHEKIKEDIIVKAGAGTGKTYSMISRITYLIYKHKYTPEELSNKIYLITFTNEAADNMKDRLKKYLMSYYLLTGNIEIFKSIEVISKMKISTIHSLCKKIIDKFASGIGLGSESKITQAIRERDKIIEKNIDEYIYNNHPGKNILDLFDFRTFEFTKRIAGILEKIEQKNILLTDEYSFGEGRTSIHEIIKTIIPKIQTELLIQANENNSVRLSQLIIIIRELLKGINENVIEDIGIDYLFIDEFQDTDDIQIDLMKQFQGIFDFKFFVVGDIKQCIYRFRGAQDNAFDRLDDNNTFIYHDLVKNYRTDKSLLELYHPIFKNWGERRYLEYDNSSKLIGTKKINKEDNQLINIRYSEEEFDEQFINVLRDEVERLKIKSLECNKKYTISVLVRKNKEIDKIKSICEKNEIQIEADSSGNLYNIEPTRDFYILLLAMKYNKDPKCLFNIFETMYTTKKEDRSIMFKFKGDKESLINYFKDINPIEGFDKYISRLNKEPIMKVIRELVFNIKPWVIYSKKYPQEERERRALYYKRNLELVLEDIIKTYNNDYLTIGKIVDVLNVRIFTKSQAEERESVLLDDGAGVSVIAKTIHKSKGLEYDTVILPYCDVDINQQKPKGPVEVIIEGNRIGYSILVDNPYDRDEKSFARLQNENYNDESDKEAKYKFNEEVRILYVAVTRSISKTIYFSSTKIPSRTEKRWQDLINI